ncbi:MAG: phage integrase N-terminal SAM-like domain-containing protein [bacterium]
MRIVKTREGRLRLIFPFNNQLMKRIRNFPYHRWDNKNKWWTIPFSERYLSELQEYAVEVNWVVKFEEEKKDVSAVKRATPFDVPNYRPCPPEMSAKLTELRYSPRTLKIYTSLFEEFINYHYSLEINNITEPQIIQFIRFLVTDRKVSTSYQNQAINAIKFYYERVLGGQRKFYFIDRPIKEKTLPTVLNEEETVALFRAVDNIKHKCMLMLA